MKINSGGPAFPQTQVDFGNGPEDPEPFGMGGMTLRAYFAGQALIGFSHSPSAMDRRLQIAENCVLMADALIAELAKPGNAKAEGGEG